MSKKRKKTDSEEEKWFFTVVPLKCSKFFLAFRREQGLECLFDNEWCALYGLDIEQDVVSETCDGKSQAFWTCYQKFVEYVEMYGIDRVRADVFPDVLLSPAALSHIFGLLNFKVVCNFYQVTCARCLKVGHSAEVCFAESSKDGEIIDQEFFTSSSSSSD
jgi:hypothetical protein